MPGSFRGRTAPPLDGIGSGDEAAGAAPARPADASAPLEGGSSSSSSPAPAGGLAQAAGLLGCKVRNLDTGEERDLLREDSRALAFFGKWVDPGKLRRRTVNAWDGWWQEQRQRNEALWLAAETGDVEELRRLLTSFPSTVTAAPPEAACSLPTTSGSTRCTYGSLIAGSTLSRPQGRSLSTFSAASAPPRVDSRGLHGRTALHLAAAGGHTACVEELLELGASIDEVTHSGYSAAHLAARHGHLEVLQLLASHGCKLNLQTHEGETPLHLATACAHQQVVTFLLDRADADDLALRNKFGQRASEVCSDIATMQLFRTFLATPQASVVEHPCESHSVLDMSFASCCQDGYAGRTPFHSGGVLLRNSRADMVRRLLDRTGAREEPKLPAHSPEQAEWVLSFGCPGGPDAGDGDASAGGGGSLMLPARSQPWMNRAATAPEGPRPRAASGSFPSSPVLGGRGLPPPSPVLGRVPPSPAQSSRGPGNWSPRGERDARRRPSFCQISNEESSVEVVDPSSFQILQILGKGSFGEVYQVTHKKTGQVFAMKVLRKSKIIGKNLLRYARTERNLMSYIRHPFIVRLHYAFQTPSCLVLVLQYCPGGNLSSLIAREGCLPEALAKLYLAEVFLAVEHLHERQVVYRDLKPENIVLDETSHAMLTDFGLSKEGVEGLHGTSSFCGSVAYLAPEILARQGHGPTVDLYGLGVLLYEVLAGHPPFYSRDRDQLFRNIASAPLHAPPRASPSAARLICALMQRDPSRRPGANKTSELRNHQFFGGIEWDKLLRREVAVPPLRRSSRAGAGAAQGTAEPADRAAPRDKVASPFEGRMWQVNKYWSGSSKEQYVTGWEFATSPQLGRRTVTS